MQNLMLQWHLTLKMMASKMRASSMMEQERAGATHIKTKAASIVGSRKESTFWFCAVLPPPPCPKTGKSPKSGGPTGGGLWTSRSLAGFQSQFQGDGPKNGGPTGGVVFGQAGLWTRGGGVPLYCGTSLSNDKVPPTMGKPKDKEPLQGFGLIF